MFIRFGFRLCARQNITNIIFYLASTTSYDFSINFLDSKTSILVNKYTYKKIKLNLPLIARGWGGGGVKMNASFLSYSLPYCGHYVVTLP